MRDQLVCMLWWIVVLWWFSVVVVMVWLIAVFGYICESSHGSQIVDQKLFESIESIFDLSPISQISDLCYSSQWRVMNDDTV